MISSVASVIGSLKRRLPAEHPADGIDLRHVRMAGDNDVYAEGHWIDLQRLEVVKHEDGSSREPDEFGVGVFARPITGVHISSDRGDRRNLAKRADDVVPLCREVDEQL